LPCPLRSRRIDASQQGYAQLGQYHYRYYNDSVNADFAWPFLGQRAFPSHLDYIDDVVGALRSFNPVSHRVVNSQFGGFQDYQDANGYVTMPRGMQVSFPLAPGDSFLDWVWHPIISSATLSDWSLEAFNRFHDQIPMAVSIPNFLYELKDMKGMIPSIDRHSLTKTASNNFLAFEFGVKPFIDDIKNMLELSDKVTKRLQHLIATTGRATSLSFKRDAVFEEPLSFYRNILNSGTANDGFGVRFQRQSARCTFTATGKLYQDLEDLSSQVSMMKALASAGGFNRPARVIWNAIPYSFVVDWFFRFGKILDTLTIQPFGGEFSVSHVGYSLKAESTWLVFQELGSNYTPQSKLIGTVWYKGYERKEGLPLVSVIATDASLTPKQQALSLAMLEQRR
jgi:hypothetical protein